MEMFSLNVAFFLTCIPHFLFKKQDDTAHKDV